MPPLKIFWILSPLSWVSESYRQDIGQFHSPRMKPCKAADYFIKVNFRVVVRIWSRASPNHFLDLKFGKFVLLLKVYLS